MNSPYPRIVTPFDREPEKSRNPYYVTAVTHIMSQVFPPHFFEGNVKEHFHEKLPLVSWSPLEEAPFNLSFFMCSPFRENTFRYFCEMIRQWLIPGKQMNILLQFAVDFLMPEISSDCYIAGQLMLRVEQERELEIIQKNLPILEGELRLGMRSTYQATRILETKGLSYDQKTSLIQENITQLVKNRPQDFDYDIVCQMQHFLVLCKEEFKAAHEYRHLSRIICIHYLFRKALKLSLDVFPDRRYISVKLIRALIDQKKRRVLGIVIGMSFLRENEMFEARHIMSAVKTILPDVRQVEGSYFINQGRSDATCMVYIEIERGEEMISLEEERLLKEELPSQLKNRIEQRVNPIFMPQNEEEVMRHIVTLSHELKYVRDLPQVIINFTQQIDESLEFIVIAVRIKRQNSIPFQLCFELRPTFLEYIPDRRKIVGAIREKYKKEANVFRLRIQKAPFLRQDHSVDLYKARSAVTQELARVVGEFRDYNGGTISKEAELFEALQTDLGELADANGFLLKNFFYSLSPPVMRSILPVAAMKKLFTMLLHAEMEGVTPEQCYQIRMEEDESNSYLLVTAINLSFQVELQALIDSLETHDIASCLLQNAEFPCFGVICRHHDVEEARDLWFRIEEVMSEW